MSMIPRDVSDTSVTFSLAELARIEAERVREEDAQRAQVREREARERRQVDAARRAAEAAEAERAAEARVRRIREEEDERARREARQRAELEVARIAAEAKAKLDADNALRAHEIEVLRVRTTGGRLRLQIALAAVIGVAILGGGAAAYAVYQHVTAIARDTEKLRDAQQALGREREQAKATELAALDRRLSLLAARPLAAEAGDARRTAEAAKGAVDPRALDQDRLRAYADALDAFGARIDTLDRLAALDQRRDDLASWADDRRHGEAMKAARTAGTRARLLGTSEAIAAYEAALDQVRGSLSHAPVAATGHQVAASSDGKRSGCKPCLAGDPGCGLDGCSIF